MEKVVVLPKGECPYGNGAASFCEGDTEVKVLSFDEVEVPLGRTTE